MWILGVFVVMAGLFDPLGPTPEGYRVVSEELGPDLIRVGFEGESRLWIEVTPDRGAPGFCRADGLVVQLRVDLNLDQESFELDNAPAPLVVACAGLASAAPELKAKMQAAAADRPPGSSPTPAASEFATPEASRRITPPPRFRPWMVVVLLTAGLGLLVGGRARRLLPAAVPLSLVLLTLVAIGLRRVFSTPTTLLGGDAAYERFSTALGADDLDRYYGETWPSVFGLLRALDLLLGPPDRRTDVWVHDLNLLASACTPALGWVLARQLGLGAGAWVVGALLVGLPQAVELAQIEDHVVLVAFLQALAGCAALAARRGGWPELGLCVGSAALLAHLRPEQVLTALALMVPVWMAGRTWVFVAGAALVLGRFAYLPVLASSGPIAWSRLLHPWEWANMLQAWLVAPAVPLPGLVLLAGLGGMAALHDWRRRPTHGAERLVDTRWAGLVWVGLVWACTTLPYLPKQDPAADPLRFSLPSQLWLVLLAVEGARAWWAWAPRPRAWAAAVLLVVSLGPWIGGGLLRTGGAHPRPWAWEAEYQFLVEVVPGRAAGAARGWYDDSQDPHGAFGRWLGELSGVPWSGWSDQPPAPGDLVFRGTADRLAGAWPGQRCGLLPLAERGVSPVTDGWVDLEANTKGPVRLGLYRVRECPP